MFKLPLMLLSVLLAGCATSLPEVDQPATHARPAPAHSPLRQAFAPLTARNPGLSGVYPVADGREALIIRILAANQAVSSIDLQTYIYRGDDTGRALLWSLWRAAERGVRVRLLLDDMQSGKDQALSRLNRHPNVQVRLFNPFTNRQWRSVEMLGSFQRTNRRMHNKSMVVDGALAVTGGRNIGNEYFSANQQVSFGDFDVMLLGPAVADTAAQFDLYWNSDYAIGVEHLIPASPAITTETMTRQFAETIQRDQIRQQGYIDALHDTPLARHLADKTLPLYWGKVQVVADSPEKAAIAQQAPTLMMDALARQFEQAEQNLLLVSPYFVPGEPGVKALAKLVGQGVRVRVLTNSLAATDVVAVHSGYRGYRRAMLEAGVELWEVKRTPGLKPGGWNTSSQASLHAKTMVFDRRVLFVGSFNLDPRSARINTEMGVFIHSDELASEVSDGLGEALSTIAYRLTLEEGELRWQDLESGTTLDSEPDAGCWRRLGAWLLQWLPIEDQL
ncbi:phospholipase D family protein [Ferrimonas sediminicola]|uniref:Phospholipase D family protein n=1 Tax=Ferrimonas sediminicola TaxID=2569538 RepID=A0A4U1BD13_9GAMM|nr:phospholipase D family protein [Ferrimonas sediminicola]TKB48959.1 phospholipase D family protein [Ferrimonas sediminicola]